MGEKHIQLSEATLILLNQMNAQDKVNRFEAALARKEQFVAINATLFNQESKLQLADHAFMAGYIEGTLHSLRLKIAESLNEQEVSNG